LVPVLAGACPAPEDAPEARFTPGHPAASERASQPAPASRAATLLATPADPRVPDPRVPDPRIVVAGEQGLSIYSAEGKLLRVVKRRPASAPRYLAGRSAVVYLGGPSRGALGFSGVWRLDLVTGEHKLVARMPLLRMARTDEPGASAGTLAPDTDAGAWVEPPDRALCLRLVDAWGDATNVIVSMRVDLQSGKVTYHPELVLSGYRWLTPPPERGEGDELCGEPPAERDDEVEAELRDARALPLLDRRGGTAGRAARRPRAPRAALPP